MQLLCATYWACETFVEVWWCGFVFGRSESHLHGGEQAPQLQVVSTAAVGRGPWSTKELEDV